MSGFAASFILPTSILIAPWSEHPLVQSLLLLLQINFMKRQGMLDKTFNRRRDEQSMYMEESCKFKHLMKRAGANAAAPVKA